MASSARLPLASDLVTILESKAKALEAFDKHLRGSGAGEDDEIVHLFRTMRDDEARHVQLLKELLVRCLHDAERLENERLDDEDEMDADELEALDEHYEEDAPRGGPSPRRP